MRSIMFVLSDGLARSAAVRELLGLQVAHRLAVAAAQGQPLPAAEAAAELTRHRPALAPVAARAYRHMAAGEGRTLQ